MHRPAGRSGRLRREAADAHHCRGAGPGQGPLRNTTKSCRSAPSSTPCPSTCMAANWSGPGHRKDQGGRGSLTSKGRKIWTPKPAEPMPEKLDWDQWCNQTEIRPFRNELRAHWALFRDYDGGGRFPGVSGWGTHALDQVQAARHWAPTTPARSRSGPRSPARRAG